MDELGEAIKKKWLVELEVRCVKRAKEERGEEQSESEKRSNKKAKQPSSQDDLDVQHEAKSKNLEYQK